MFDWVVFTMGGFNRGRAVKKVYTARSFIGRDNHAHFTPSLYTTKLNAPSLFEGQGNSRLGIA